MKKICAPVILFSYNRIEHLKRTLSALKLNPESTRTELHIFQDGPKNENDEEKIKKIMKYLKFQNGFKKIIIEQSDKNLGLSTSIKTGINKILESHDQVIILEDDIVVSSNFLKFMNDGLEIYQNEKNVASIHGYVYPVPGRLPDTFFLKGSDCWGWATWRRAWLKYNDNGVELLKKLQDSKDIETFDFEGYGGYIKMLQDANQGRNDSWAIKWYASVFLEEMYTLYPGKTLVMNIGRDGTGTHGGKNKKASNQKFGQDIIIQKIQIEDNETARKAFVKYFKSQNLYLRHKILMKIRNVLNR